MKKSFFFFKHYKIICLFAAIAIVVTCCNTTKPVSSAANSATILPSAPVKSDVAIARAYWPRITLNNLKQGYIIFGDKCTQCHAAKQPQGFSVFAWNGIMHKMGRKAKLDSNQYNLVLHYILTKRESILGAGK
jgi:hypothetical protein